MTDSQRPPMPPKNPLVPPPPPRRSAAPRSGESQKSTTQTLGSAATEAMPVGGPPSPPPMGKAPTEERRRSPGMPALADIVQEAFGRGFSDIHVGVGEVPRFRDRGEICRTNYPVTDEGTFFTWLAEILPDLAIQRFKDHLDYDGAAEYDFARVRINLFHTLQGPSMVMRIVPRRIVTLDELSLPSVFKDICHYQKGLVLITGPTGAGKSTTLAAMVDYINREMPKNIITIEDPVEFVHTSQRSLIKQREVGVHTLQFEQALRASLREDPDVILLGELRDRETVDTALKAAQTGHLVLGTLHTNSAVKTVERVLNMYEPDQQAPVRISLAEALVAVVAQGLCRTTDGKRAAFHDIMINTDAIRDYLSQGDLDAVEELIPRCTFDGMCTMNQSLYQLYEAGRITEETALEMSPRSNEMAQLLRGRV